VAASPDPGRLRNSLDELVQLAPATRRYLLEVDEGADWAANSSAAAQKYSGFPQFLPTTRDAAIVIFGTRVTQSAGYEHYRNSPISTKPGRFSEPNPSTGARALFRLRSWPRTVLFWNRTLG